MTVQDSEVPLPSLNLEGEEFLEAYTARSMLVADSDRAVSWTRSAFFGEKLLEFAIVGHWFTKEPSLPAEKLKTRFEEFLSDGLLQRCIGEYNLAAHIPLPDGNIIGERECQDFLTINVAKLYERGGTSAVQTWVSALIDPSVPRPPEPMGHAGTSHAPEPSEPAPPAPPSYSARPEASSVNDSQEPLAFVTLAVFNEYATQRKNYKVSWEAESSGDHHRLSWTVKCLLDGQEKGAGQAHSQKVAKEKAAREVWRAMGWSTVPTEPASPPSSPFLPQSHQPLAIQSSTPAPPAYSDDPSLAWLTLSIFNHTVQQQRRSIDWQQESTGQSHMPSWRVTCIIDGQVAGIGDARNTKEAKLFAARNAWKRMGWGGMPAA